MKILLVDDSQAVRRVAAHILRRAGHEVVEAGTAHEALAAARNVALDALVTDLVMPELDGSALADALRDVQPGLAVVIMSGLGPPAHVTNATFVAKPFTPESLRAAVLSAEPGEGRHSCELSIAG